MNKQIDAAEVESRCHAASEAWLDAVATANMFDKMADAADAAVQDAIQADGQDMAGAASMLGEIHLTARDAVLTARRAAMAMFRAAGWYTIARRGAAAGKIAEHDVTECGAALKADAESALAAADIAAMDADAAADAASGALEYSIEHSMNSRAADVVRAALRTVDVASKNMASSAADCKTITALAAQAAAMAVDAAPAPEPADESADAEALRLGRRMQRRAGDPPVAAADALMAVQSEPADGAAPDGAAVQNCAGYTTPHHGAAR